MDLTFPFDDFCTPELIRAAEERRELLRIAAQAALDRSRGGKDLDPWYRAWAKHYAAFKPLGRPLGNGELAPSENRSAT